MPAVSRDSIANGVSFSDPEISAIAIPGASRSITSFVAEKKGTGSVVFMDDEVIRMSRLHLPESRL